MFATLFLRSDCYDTVKYELEEFDPALDLLDSQDAEAANQHLSDVQTQDLHQQFRRDLKVFSLRTFKKKFRDSLGHHRTSVHRRFAYQTASQQLHPRHTGQRLCTQTFEGLSYKEAKKVMPSNVFLYRYEQYRRWVVNTGGIQRNGSWGVNRYFQRCFELCRWSWACVLDSQGLDMLDCAVAGVFPARTVDSDADQVLIQESYITL